VPSQVPVLQVRPAQQICVLPPQASQLPIKLQANDTAHQRESPQHRSPEPPHERQVGAPRPPQVVSGAVQPIPPPQQA
jgi:hypothetical protein